MYAIDLSFVMITREAVSNRPEQRWNVYCVYNAVNMITIKAGAEAPAPMPPLANTYRAHRIASQHHTTMMTMTTTPASAAAANSNRCGSN